MTKTLKRGKAVTPADQSAVTASPTPRTKQRDIPIIPSESLPVTLAQFSAEWGVSDGSN